MSPTPPTAEALEPPAELLRELEEIARAHGDLGDLLRPQPDEPDVPEHELLCRGSSPYYVVRVPIPGAPGKLWVSRIPWLRQQPTNALTALRLFGIDRIVCLVPAVQLESLHLAGDYLAEAEKAFPGRVDQVDILDHEVPPDDGQFETCIEQIRSALGAGEAVLVHCIGGCGRTGMFVSALLIRAGLAPLEAIREFRRRRRCGPETLQQLAYVFRYAKRLKPPETEEPPPPAVRLTRHRGAPRLLAEGGLASIFLGRLLLGGGRRRRVAVKCFRYQISDDEAEAMRTCIDALRRAGVLLPRMAVCRLDDGKWAAISPLFGATSGSKLSQRAGFYKSLTAAEKDFALAQLARVAEAGYTPSLDLFLEFEPPRRGIVPLDLDLIVREDREKVRGARLLRCVLQVGENAAERDRLLEVVLAEVGVPLAGTIRVLLDAENSPYRATWDLE